MWEREEAALSPHGSNPSPLPRGPKSHSSGFGTNPGRAFSCLESQIPSKSLFAGEKQQWFVTYREIKSQGIHFWEIFERNNFRTIPWPWKRCLWWDPAPSNSSMLNIPALEKDRDKGNCFSWRHRELQPGHRDFVGMSTGILGHYGIKGSRDELSLKKTPNPNWHHSKKSLFFKIKTIPHSTYLFLSWKKLIPAFF